MSYFSVENSNSYIFAALNFKKAKDDCIEKFAELSVKVQSGVCYFDIS
jgi:hypothetical protein